MNSRHITPLQRKPQSSSRVMRPSIETAASSPPVTEPFPWEHAGPTPVQPAPQEPEGQATNADSTQALEERIQSLEKLVEARSREAYQAGQEAARKQIQQTYSNSLENLASALGELKDWRSSLYKESESELVRLSLAVARRIIHREISVSPDALKGLISVALEKLEDQEVYKIYTHPQQLEAVRQAFSSLQIATQIDILASDSLPPGGLKFETNRGHLDASVDSQLAEIERGLTDRLPKP